MLVRLTLLALIAGISFVSAEKLTHVGPCSRGSFGSSATLKEVRITPCPNAALRRPCILKKGSNVTIEVDFTPTVAANKVVGRAYWANRMVELPLPNMNTNACDTLRCPLTPNNEHTYRYILHISNTFPLRRYDVRWKLTAPSSNFHLCFQFPIQIVN